MFRNYIKVAWRNLYRNKAMSNINIFGLALGIACSMLIYLWIDDELSIDAFHEQGDQLYTIYESQHHDGVIDAGPYTPGMLFEGLKALCPEVKYAVPMASSSETRTFEAGTKILKQEGAYAGPDFFLAFSFPLLAGQPENALKTTSDIAISNKMAHEFFGSADAALGQQIRFENSKDLRVAAVFEDMRDNSSLKYDYLLNWETFLEQHGWARDWGNNGPATYVVLHPDADVHAFGEKILNFLADKHPDSQSKNFVINLHLQKFSDGYLHSRFENGEIVGGRIQYVRLFAVVAVFILLIAAINFMNLTTARSLRRAREIGVRKVVGAIRLSLVRQFIGESMLIACLAFVLGVLMVALVLPSFNLITQKHIILPVINIAFWSRWIAILLITGLISGGYPALYLSAFNPVKALRGALKFTSGAVWFRRSLVVFQFVLSIMLIVGTIVISRQVHFVQSAQLGYDRENLLYIPLEGDLSARYEAFKIQALNTPGVGSVSCTSNNPTNITNGTGGVQWEGKDPNSLVQFTQAGIGFDYIKTMNIQLLQGRDFSLNVASDSVGYIVNERALNLFNYKDPIGMPLTMWGRKGTIVGVVKDFHFSSMHEGIRPLILHFEGIRGMKWAVVRAKAGSTTDVLAGLERICHELNPRFPFTYRFSDEEYKKLYTSEMIVEKLSNAFAGMAIFISCLGLLGLTIFSAEQRTKEIGIRKVLGASLSSLFALMSRELLLLVSIAMLIASPLAWYVMNDWLSEYAYRTELAWWIFPVAGAAAIVIAIGAVSFQTVRALLVNPVNSLRSE
jgi:ABC-type antimicrobial peptide transport system permease subunit